MEEQKQLVALKDFIIGLENERELVTESGIVMGSPFGIGGALNYVVESVGPEVKEVKVGDEIAVEWAKGKFFFVDTKKFIVIQEKYVGAILEK